MISCQLLSNEEADVRAYNEGKPCSGDGLKYANVDDGRMGVYFITKSVESSRNGGAWVEMNSGRTR